MSKLAASVEAAVKASKKEKNKKAAKSKPDGKAKAKAPVTGIVLSKPEPILTKEFLSNAKAADEEIRSDVFSIQRDLTSLGAKFNSFRDHGWHKGVGFENFDAWVDDVAQERGMKHSQIRLAMKINKSLVGVGEGKLPAKEVSKMTLQNAVLLSRVPAKSRTAKVVEAAQTLTEKRFQSEIVLPIMKKANLLHEVPKGKGIDPKRPGEIAKIGPYHVSKEVAEQWAYAMEIAAWKVRDDDTDTPVSEKALDAIAADFIASYSKEYEDGIDVQAKQEEAGAEAAAS